MILHANNLYFREKALVLKNNANIILNEINENQVKENIKEKEKENQIKENIKEKGKENQIKEKIKKNGKKECQTPSAV